MSPRSRTPASAASSTRSSRTVCTPPWSHCLFEGGISAEHGVGLLKREFLEFSRSAAEIEIMRAVKRALDPNAVMNPGKLLPDQ